MRKEWSEEVQESSQTGGVRDLEGLLREVNLEAAFYGLVFLMAVGLRLWGLGDRPLQEVEASQAFSAWRFYRGEAEGLIPGYSPPLLYGQLLSFIVWGVNDFTVRIWPALAGALVAISPALLRRQLGRWGALGASVLATFSPSLMFFSRFGTGDMLALLGAAGLVIGVLRFGRSGEARDLRILVLGLALALCAGPEGYTVLLAVILWTGMLALGRSRWTDVGCWWEELSRSWCARRELWGPAVGIFGVAFLLLSTGLLLNFDGLYGGIAQLGRWVEGLAGESPGLSWHYPLQVLMLYEFLPLVLGLVGIAAWWSSRRRSQAGGLLAWWFGFSLVLHLVAGGKDPAHLSQTAFPLVLLGGIGLEWLATRFKGCLKGGPDVYVGAASLVILTFVLLRVLGFAYLGQGEILLVAFLALLLLAALIALISMFGVWFGLGQGPAGAIAAVLLLLSAFSVRTAWGVNFLRSSDPMEPLVVAPTSLDVRALVSALEGLSMRRQGAPHVLSIGAQTAHEDVLGWYLREFDRANLGASNAESTPADAIISDLPEGGELPQGPEGYVGQRFEVRFSWSLEELQVGLGDPHFWRWLLDRQAPGSLSYRDVILWTLRERP